MLKYLVALVAVLLVADAASACHRPHLLQTLSHRVVHRERHVTAERHGLFAGWGKAASPCAGGTCTAPAPAPVVTPKKK